MSEEIIYGSVNNVSGKKGLLGTEKDYDLIFTNTRIIVAMVSNKGTAGLLGGDVGWAISKLGKNKKREKYQSLNPESIIKASSKNYEIPYSNIKEVKLQETWPWCFLVFDTIKGTKRFEVKKKELDAVKRLTDLCLSDKVNSN